MSIDGAEERVPGYRLLRRIGAGAMGTVYAALRPGESREVALKLLHPDHVLQPTLVRRFLVEASAIGRIAHDNVVRILDCGQAPDGAWYIAMELVEGRSLRRVLDEQGGPLPLPRALAIAAEIADGVAATHAQGIVHRDLKPDNVMIDTVVEIDRVTLLDFGLAKMTQPLAGRLTLQGAIVGTPDYMAPELISDASLAGPAADVYALGCMLFEMCTAKRPFSAHGYEVLVRQVYDAPPSPRAIAPALPAWLDQLVLTMLAKDPTERPTMAELAATLRARAWEVLAPPAAPVTATHEVRREVAFEPMTFAPIEFEPAGARARALDTLPPGAPSPTRWVVRIAATALVLMTALGIGSLIGQRRGGRDATSVSVDSVPPGATVYEREAVLGTTPLVLLRKPGSTIRELRLEREGYQTLVLSIAADGNVRTSVRLNPLLKPEPPPDAALNASRGATEHRRERRDQPHDDPKNGLLRVRF
jgi:serine/threonine-protein kinase